METKKLKYGSLMTSVQDPQQFSQTMGAILKGVGFVLMMLLAHKGVDAAVSAKLVNDLLTYITASASGLVVSWQAGVALEGAVKKVFAALNA